MHRLRGLNAGSTGYPEVPNRDVQVRAAISFGKNLYGTAPAMA